MSGTLKPDPRWKGPFGPPYGPAYNYCPTCRRDVRFFNGKHGEPTCPKPAAPRSEAT